MTFPLAPFIFGTVMMLVLTGAVYTTIGDSKESCKGNTVLNDFNICVQTMDNAKTLVNVGWIIYLTIGLISLVGSIFKTESINDKPNMRDAIHNNGDVKQ